jgi:hypothetical protein
MNLIAREMIGMIWLLNEFSWLQENGRVLLFSTGEGRSNFETFKFCYCI